MNVTLKFFINLSPLWRPVTILVSLNLNVSTELFHVCCVFLFLEPSLARFVCFTYKLWTVKWRILSQTSTEESDKNKKKKYFSYWAASTPWGHVLSLKTFCRNPVLSWAIRHSVFQPVKFSTSFKFNFNGNPFSTFWNLLVKFGYIKWF